MKSMLRAWLLTSIACLLCSCGDRNSSSQSYGAQTVYRFDNYTLGQAIEHVQDKKGWHAYSFRIKNDRKFEHLVFRDVINRSDLLREIKFETHGEVMEAGHSTLIILPKLK
jgi:hypothetical protein